MPAHSPTINLLPQTIIQEQGTAKILHWSLTYGRYIIIVTELIVLGVFFARFNLDQQITDLHESIKQKQKIIALSSNFESQVRKLQVRIDKIKPLADSSSFYSDTIDLLETLVPEDVVISKLDYTSNHFRFEANSHTRSGFARLMRNLKSSNKIRNISVENITRVDKTTNLLRFSLSFEIVPGAFL